MPNKTSTLIILATASLALTLGVAACNRTDIQEAGAQNQPAQSDNLAPVNGTQTADANTQQQPATQTTQQSYQQPSPVQQAASAPAQQQGSQDQTYSDTQPNASYQDASYGQPVLQAQQPPPPLPEYSQPPCPGNGYLWTPGYWSYAPQGYYWVPGAWAWPPQIGSCGPPDIGDSWQGCTATTTDPGASMSATTEVLTTATDTPARATRVVIGAEIGSTTIVPSTT